MKKLDRLNWSRVEKPDMGKITNQRFRGLLDEWYRNESSIGNKSTADVLRYERVTGILKSRTGHEQKCEDIRNTLAKNNGLYESLNIEEKKIAEMIYADVSSALNNK